MADLITAILILLIGSAFCSSSEAAVFSIPKPKIEALVNQKRRGAKTLLQIKENISDSVGAIVILNNLFNIVGSIIVGGISASLFDDFRLGLVSGILTFLVIVFGEILPKNLGERFAINYGLLVAPLVRTISVIFFPFTWILNFITKLIFGHRNESTISEEEIRVMVEKGLQEREIQHGEHLLIHNVFSLNDKVAKDIMTPRVKIEALDADLTLNEQRNEIFEFSHSRIPVYGEDIDDTEGFVLVREALTMLAEGGGETIVREIKKDILKIKETTRVDSLLTMFLKKRVQIALVLDEFGGTSGLVTLEDVVEELVGEIVDETDKVVDMRES